MIASGTMVLLLIIVLIGLDFESKAQLVLLVILIVSLFNYFIGTFLPPSEEKRRVGFVGYHGQFKKNSKAVQPCKSLYSIIQLYM